MEVNLTLVPNLEEFVEWGIDITTKNKQSDVVSTQDLKIKPVVLNIELIIYIQNKNESWDVKAKYQHMNYIDQQIWFFHIAYSSPMGMVNLTNGADWRISYTWMAWSAQCLQYHTHSQAVGDL